jgi:hypothetical protein
VLDAVTKTSSLALSNNRHSARGFIMKPLFL